MMANTKFLQLITKIIAILCLLMQGYLLCDGESNNQFIASEAEALLEFKKSLKDPSNVLSSWRVGEDCCHWKGVGCNTTTGHVISLNLHSSNSLDKLQGRELSSSLQKLPYLSYLNLCGNDFMQSSLPPFLGSMQNLKHLDLSHANFKRNIFDNLGNLSLLESLDLSGNGFYVNNLKWLRGLSSLKTLDLSGIYIGISENDWFHDIRTIIPSLKTLRLSGCGLHKLPTSLPFEVNFDSLVILDLSLNHFNSTIPDWLFEKCLHLQYLSLSKNSLHGHIPYSIERTTTLTTLDLSHNLLIGSIPPSINRLVSLVALDLFYNMLHGSIPSTLGHAHGQNSLKELHLSNNQLNGSLERNLPQLSKLVVLDLSHNNLEGNISDVHLANFSNLKVLDLSFNYVTLNMSENWVPPFQLETLGLAKCHLGSQFSKWIQTQNNFSHIDVSNTSISDIVPNWFWDLSPNVEYMNLSYNELSRCGHDLSQKIKLKTLDLSYNNFICPFPHLPPNLKILDLSNNLFYGTISPVCEVLGVNNSLETLNLSFNNLSGVIPNCWRNGTDMTILKLTTNNFIGPIPDSFGSLTSLHMLLMSKNKLSGKIPDTLSKCKVIIILDLSSSRFSGAIPFWIGTEMQILKVLVLNRNLFDENIPPTLCQLKSLQILNLYQNRLTGGIPRCVFPAMATEESVNEKSYMELLTIKETVLIYQTELVRLKIFHSAFSTGQDIFPKMIDFSSNYLTKEIPVEITKLVKLIVLNLSGNQLDGSIPSNIGDMRNLVLLDLSGNQLEGSIPFNIGEMVNLEALNLSRNQLSCVIPTTMVNMSFLGLLDLSYNDLSGKIPISTQLQSFDNDPYIGNPHLCGRPLTEKCLKNSLFKEAHCSHIEEPENGRNHEDERTSVVINPFYITMIAGFFTGFWVFWGSILLFASWRHAYFRFLNNMEDRIYVAVVVTFNKLQRKLQAQQPLQ